MGMSVRLPMRRAISSFLAIRFSIVRTLTLSAAAHSFFESNNLELVILCTPARRRFALRAEMHKRHISGNSVASDATVGNSVGRALWSAEHGQQIVLQRAVLSRGENEGYDFCPVQNLFETPHLLFEVVRTVAIVRRLCARTHTRSDLLPRGLRPRNFGLQSTNGQVFRLCRSPERSLCHEPYALNLLFWRQSCVRDHFFDHSEVNLASRVSTQRWRHPPE
jgi:hypothetical protein